METKKLTLNFDEAHEVPKVIIKPKSTNGKKKKVFNTPKRKQWAFTAFKHIDYAFYDNLYEENKELIKYLIVALEKCPDTGKLHMQSYIHLTVEKRGNQIQELMDDPTLHIEAIRKDEQTNINYCKKAGDYKEYGSKHSNRGKRNDITISLQKNKNLTEFIKNEPTLYIKYRSGVEGYYRQVVGVNYEVNDDKPLVIWLYGDTGTGKSRVIREYLRDKVSEGYRVWRRPLGKSSWFDGYAGQDIVFLDELRYITYEFNDLLQMLDYDCPQVPIKGGFVDFRPKVILITSNQHPKDVYQYINDENKEQLVRRCDKIIEIKTYIPNLLTQ